MLKAPVAEELVWASVTRPPVPLVYLDLNHYIQLAKASRSAAGHAGEGGRPIAVLPGYADLLDAARRAKAEGRARFPLSGVHFIEVAHAVPSPRQRGHVTDVMEELSDFAYLLGRPYLVRMEIAAGLDKMYDIPASHVPMPLLYHSALWALLGERIGFEFVDETGSVSGPRPREELAGEAFDAQLAGLNHIRERKLLEGPQDHEIPDLRRRGYDPDAYAAALRRRLTFELDTSTFLNLNPIWRRGRLRDQIFGREVAREWMTQLVLHLRQRADARLRHDPPLELAAFWAAMPLVQVAISMKAQYHRDPSRVWRTNDIADIDALAVAYAYCDAVLTDKQARAALAGSRELRTFGAILHANALEMANWLDGLPTVQNPDDHVPHPLSRSS
ncbi:hypothetical protein [Catellatospora sichuanensis]|uniref:hypothetical protein n=1 Tax=Catellatospora sichuanensis TaxID=1969805 RepID=UPI001181F97B|nr:hypothetical protein [Catellatospora sichuanensis]